MIITTNTTKGGETKTTSTVTIASILAVAGYKVLVVDADPQANTTFLCAANNNATTPPIVIYDLFLRANMDDNELIDTIIPTKIKGMDLIPSNESLEMVPYHLYDQIIHEGKQESTLNFHNNLVRIKKMCQYDYILIDTPPTKSYAVSATLAAADCVITGISPDNLSWQGLSMMIQAIEDNNKTYKRDTRIAGVFLIRVKPRTIRFNQMSAGYRQLLGDIFLNAYTRDNETMGKANTAMMPIVIYDRKSPVVEDYINIMIELGLLDTTDWHYLELRKYLRTGNFEKEEGN